MAVIRCKMCGGDLAYQEGMTVCECEYCGSKQTIPIADNEKKMKLFDRANRLRINCEFDKAGGVYESIIEEFPEEAEGYWGNLLCKYGIEYVDDPADGRKVPTCHRSSFDSIMDDEDFELIMENADPVARKVYREQAKEIEEIRKGIVEISAKEQPYDIFICYKETDEDGCRTLDSVLAQDIYTALTDKGYHVFFSRISLEDKLGTEYEPYIFAALNSAKIMLAFGTSYDYYNAVWVKNEWGRYLRLMAKDKTKHLIPCYKGIDAYDIPKEFAKLQAQDLGKVGAVQDLIRGIDKLMGRGGGAKKPDEFAQPIIQQITSGGPSTASLVDRGYMFLEDRAYEDAVNYYNRALDIDPKASEAYLGLYMASIKVGNRAAAKEIFISGDYMSDRNWIRAKQYASDKLLEELQGWENEARQRRAEEARAQREYEERIARDRAEYGRLNAQLSAGDFELTDEEQAELDRLTDFADRASKTAFQAEQSLRTCQENAEMSRLENEIRLREERIRGLGLFKGKIKKELQAQIETLNNSLDKVKKKVGEKKEEVNRLQDEAVLAAKNVKEFKATLNNYKILELERQMLLVTHIGDDCIFGHFEQGYGIAPIEWKILDKKNNKILLISKYALDCQKYHDDSKYVTWETCSLREWLNDTFIQTAFSSQEADEITVATVTADANIVFNQQAGNDTQDKVFLLSLTEAEKYFTDDSERACKATAHAKTQGAYVYPDSGNCWWWLRSPGKKGCYAVFVTHRGPINSSGYQVDSDNVCVRPALWINLNS